jgi:hypothetical protein
MRAMPKKPTTIRELGRLGGLARARKYSKRQLRAWSKLGGRPRKKSKGDQSR